MPTSRLPGTVLRSSAEWPCTSALGLFTRRYSAGSSNRSPFSNETVSVFLSLPRRSSVGQVSVMREVLARAGSIHKPHSAGGRQIEPAHFAGARGERLGAYKPHQALERRAEIVALAHQKIERLPDDRHEIEAGRVGDRARGDTDIGTAGADRLGDVG